MNITIIKFNINLLFCFHIAAFSTNVANDESNAYLQKEGEIARNQHILQCMSNPFKKVLLYDSCLYLFLRKLHSCWIGPFIVKMVYLCGTIEIEDSKPRHYKWKVAEALFRASITCRRIHYSNRFSTIELK